MRPYLAELSLRGAIVRAAALVFASTAVAVPKTSAQSSIVPTVGGSAVPVFSTWRFAKEITQPAGAVSGVSEFAVPMRARFIAAQRWTVDLSASMLSGSVTLKDATGNRTLSLSGLSDLTVRATGPVYGEAILVTAGLNVPTGSTNLDGDQTAALQAISAPALGMPVGALGRGFGATLGVLGAREVGDWALALGLSIEQRSEYTPVSLAVAGGSAQTSISPGAALHVSVGADRSFGENRLSVLFVTDGYASDAVSSTQPGAAQQSSQYTLGRQTSVLTRLEMAKDGWREFTMTADLRNRAPFSNDAGTAVSGSGGTYLEASLGGVRGDAGATGIVFAVDGRYHSGLKFTDALVGAATAAVGITTGIDWPGTRAGLRLIARLQAGQFDTGTTNTVGVGVTVAGTLTMRGGER